MKLSNFIEGLNTLSKYFDNPDGYHIGAEHDQFYVYATDQPLDAADVEKMKSLEWFQPEARGDDDAPYDHQEGWSAFT